MAEQKPIRGWKARQERARKRREVSPERQKVREIRRRHLLEAEGVTVDKKATAKKAAAKKKATAKKGETHENENPTPEA